MNFCKIPWSWQRNNSSMKSLSMLSSQLIFQFFVDAGLQCLHRVEWPSGTAWTVCWSSEGNSLVIHKTQVHKDYLGVVMFLIFKSILLNSKGLCPGILFRTERKVMTKQWQSMRTFALLLNTVYHLQLVGAWELIDSLWCSLTPKISRLVIPSLVVVSIPVSSFYWGKFRNGH